MKQSKMNKKIAIYALILPLDVYFLKVSKFISYLVVLMQS